MKDTGICTVHIIDTFKRPEDAAGSDLRANSMRIWGVVLSYLTCEM